MYLCIIKSSITDLLFQHIIYTILTFQWCVMVPLMLHQFASGMVLAYPAVLTPALTNGTGDIHASRDEASWIGK